MSEFDLIPQDYRLQQMLRARLKLMGNSLAALLVVSAAGYFGLGYFSKDMQNEIAKLQQQQSISSRQSAQLSRLTDRKEELGSKLSFFNGLRGGAEAARMFLAVGRAMTPEEVWFDSWDFRRAGFEVPQDQSDQTTGYFVIMPQVNGQQHIWKIETHMDIKGKAIDHAALSRFVERLYRQHEISDIRILRSERINADGIVRFNLIVTVDNAAGSMEA